MKRQYKSYDEMLAAPEKPMARPRHIESGIQRECVRLFRLFYPRYLVFSVPNGGSRNAREAAILSAEGVLPGVSDLIALAEGSILFVEMKAPKGRQSRYQKEFQQKLESKSMGYQYAVCHSVAEFMETIRKWIIKTQDEKRKLSNKERMEP